jgi:hypothetical protein
MNMDGHPLALGQLANRLANQRRCVADRRGCCGRRMVCERSESLPLSARSSAEVFPLPPRDGNQPRSDAIGPPQLTEPRQSADENILKQLVGLRQGAGGVEQHRTDQRRVTVVNRAGGLAIAGENPPGERGVVFHQRLPGLHLSGG